MLSDYSRLTRVRKGWYAATDTPVDLVRAWRVGGRLTCISALQHYGLGPNQLPAGENRESRLHVAVQRDASRLRHPDDLRKRLTARDDDDVMVHWVEMSSDLERVGAYRRLLMPLEIALEQAEHCRPRTTPAWTLRGDTL